MTGELLELVGVTKSFGGLVAVRDVSFAVRRGEIFGLIGPNGAGKTTLFSVIAGFHRPSKGQVLFEGRTITGLQPNQVCRRGVARTFQIPQPFRGLTVLENAAVGALHCCRTRRAAEDRAREVLEFVDLADKAGHKASSLTIQEQKRLEVARALASNPRLLLLDEVMAGLNPTELTFMIDMIRRIRATGVTVLAIEHVMRAVMSMCDRIAVLNQRLIALGDPATIAHHPSVIEAYLGREYRFAQS